MAAATLATILAGDAKKGDVIGAARIAGIMAAKKTSDLIPLCHPIAADQGRRRHRARRGPARPRRSRRGALRRADRRRDGGADRGRGRLPHHLRHGQGDRPRHERSKACGFSRSAAASRANGGPEDAASDERHDHRRGGARARAGLGRGAARRGAGRARKALRPRAGARPCGAAHPAALRQFGDGRLRAARRRRGARRRVARRHRRIRGGARLRRRGAARARRCASSPARRCRQAPTRSSIQEDVAARGRPHRRSPRPSPPATTCARDGHRLPRGRGAAPGRAAPDRRATSRSRRRRTTPRLAVRRRARVAILATGDELVAPGEPLGPSQIVASNNFAVAGIVEACGGVADRPRHRPRHDGRARRRHSRRRSRPRPTCW